MPSTASSLASIVIIVTSSRPASFANAEALSLSILFFPVLSFKTPLPRRHLRLTESLAPHVKMKLIHVLQMTFVLLTSFAMSISASANEDKSKKKDSTRYTLIPAYLLVAVLLFIFITWALWRIIHNWGSWKIHAPSPRPQYLRTLHGWVDRETLELKQAKRAKRKKAKRDQHKFYRTTRANYKWVFHDPTGELQQRFDDQKKRSYLRLLPSWMRSYPHGTLQSGTLVEQGKALKGIDQLLELQISSHSRLTISEPLEYAQLDGYPMSRALRDPYRLPDLPIMEYPDAIMSGAAEKSYLLSKLPMMDQPDVIQIWRVRENPLPERMGRPRCESEEELNGELETQETLIRRDTEYRLRWGRPQERMNLFYTVPIDQLGRPLPPIFSTSPVRHPRVFSIQPLRDTPGPEAVERATRRQLYIQGLERLIQELHTDPTFMLVRGTLDRLMQEVPQATGARYRQAPIASRPPVLVQDPPVPENVRRANRLQSHIENLERRIHDLRTEPQLTPVRGTLDSLMHELRGARAARERLGPVASLHPAVPTGQPQLQIRTDQVQDPTLNTVVGFRPRPEAVSYLWRFGLTVQGFVEFMISINILDRYATENLQDYLGYLQNGSDVLDVQAFTSSENVANSIFQGLAETRAGMARAHRTIQRILRNVFNIDTLTLQTRGEANHAVIEGPASDNNASPNPISEEEVHGGGDRAAVEGPTIDGTSSRNPTSEVEIRPDTQHPIAAALLRSEPDHDVTLDQADPAVQRHLESEETVRAEATRQTAAFYTEMGRSDPVHAQDVRTDNNATPTDTLHSPSSPPAALPPPTASATPATVTATPSSQDLEDALNEALYTDAYP